MSSRQPRMSFRVQVGQIVCMAVLSTMGIGSTGFAQGLRYEGVFTPTSGEAQAPCDAIFNDHSMASSWYLTGADRHVAVVHFTDLDGSGEETAFLHGMTLVGNLGTSDVLFEKKLARRSYRYEIVSEGYWETQALYLETAVKVFDGASPAGASPVCEVTADYLGTPVP